MNKKEQRITIAEALGWKFVAYEQQEHATAYKWEHPDGRSEWGDSAVPDYLSDLNAMSEAEKHYGFQFELELNYTTKKYRIELMAVCIRDATNDVFCATAAQRAEAFLRTLNLWKD